MLIYFEGALNITFKMQTNTVKYNELEINLKIVWLCKVDLDVRALFQSSSPSYESWLLICWLIVNGRPFSHTPWGEDSSHRPPTSPDVSPGINTTWPSSSRHLPSDGQPLLMMPRVWQFRGLFDQVSTLRVNDLHRYRRREQNGGWGSQGSVIRSISSVNQSVSETEGHQGPMPCLWMHFLLKQWKIFMSN